MRSPHSRLLTAERLASPHGSVRGFSLVELLVTIVLAGIIFAAMVPFFANALSRSSEDEVRVDAAAIAQDRIEQVRLLPYADITTNNLNYSPSPAANPFGDGRFGSSYTLAGESRPYTISYVVDPASDATAVQKEISVSVSRPGSSYVTTATTIIKNPAEGRELSTAYPSPSALPNLSMTVWFDNWTYVKTPGVYITRIQTNVTPNATITVPASTASPLLLQQMPVSSHQQLVWSNMTGGPNYTYQIFVNSTKASYVLACPPFRLWKSGRIKFDTYPGGD
jgi:prepilin-type N-terminal cleavage/methylation domain-containing protein